MSLFPSSVVHEVTGAESNLIYRALDSYATHFDSGLTRDRLDGLLAKIAADNKRAFLAEQANARGAQFLRDIFGTPDAVAVADAADPGRTA